MSSTFLIRTSPIDYNHLSHLGGLRCESRMTQGKGGDRSFLHQPVTSSHKRGSQRDYNQVPGRRRRRGEGEEEGGGGGGRGRRGEEGGGGGEGWFPHLLLGLIGTSRYRWGRVDVQYSLSTLCIGCN